MAVIASDSCRAARPGSLGVRGSLYLPWRHPRLCVDIELEPREASSKVRINRQRVRDGVVRVVLAWVGERAGFFFCRSV